MQPGDDRSSLTRRFLALSTKGASDESRGALRAEIEAIDVPPLTRVSGLPISPHPSRRFKAIRFVEIERLDPSVRDRFIRPLSNLPNLAAAFADPEELTLRTFENIVSLDGFFRGSQLEELALTRTSQNEGGAVVTLRVDAPRALAERLAKLDELDLYVTPLNAGSRGGVRFIFHSAELSEALTRAMKSELGAALPTGFSHVNPVFRCNRFEPDDRPFELHHDSPYFDPNRKHISRYTLLLYITGGRGSPAFEIPGLHALEEIAPLSCLVLDQRHPHEGRPFDDGRKVFLRSELVFEEPALTYDPSIGSLFSKAVYLTTESVFQPELERWAETAYNRAASGHWRGHVDAALQTPLLQKTIDGLSFVTNGYDFYFSADAITLEEAAAIALLDFFNCELDGVAFRKRETSRPLTESETPAAAIAGTRSTRDSSIALPIDKELFFVELEAANKNCCSAHEEDDAFIPSRNATIQDRFATVSRALRSILFPAPVLFMGEKVLIDPSRFVVDGDKLHVLSGSAGAPVHFAGGICWYDEPPGGYIDVETTVRVLDLVVPPILFGRVDGLWHLRFDFFRNGWMVTSSTCDVPIPFIRDDLSPSQAAEPERRALAATWHELSKQAPPQESRRRSTSPLLETLETIRRRR